MGFCLQAKLIWPVPLLLAGLALSWFPVVAGSEQQHLPADRVPVPARRLLYRTDSWWVRGQAELEYNYGSLFRMATPLPFENTHERVRRQFRKMADREVLALSGKVRVMMLADYTMEAYLDTERWEPLRAVRWKRGNPDVLIDFDEQRTIFLTRAEPVVRGLAGRLGKFFRGTGGDQPEFEILGPYPELPTSGDLVDLLTVLFQLEQIFTASPNSPDKVFFLSAMRKSTSSIYVGRFAPTGRRPISIKVNDTWLRRWAVRCEVTLHYGLPVKLVADDSVEGLAADYMPDLPRSEAAAIVRELFRENDPGKLAGTPVIMPVSVSVYNRIHDDDKDFQGPFGLSDSLILWVDQELGIPLRLESRIYGFSGNLLLDRCDEDFFRLLQ